MMKLIVQMMRMPMVLFVSSFEAFSRAMREMQRSFDHGVSSMLDPAAPPPGLRAGETAEPSGSSGNGDPSRANVNFPMFSPDPKREETPMPSQWLGSCDSASTNGDDLSGEDVKVVRYRIIFTKPDREHSFEERTEVVAYSTNGASLGGLKVSHFIGDLEKQITLPDPWRHPHTFPRPKVWVDYDYPDPPNFPANRQMAETHPEAIEYNWRIPKEDERYIEFQYEVIRREPKQDPYYDRDRNRDLLKIRGSIDRLTEVLLAREIREEVQAETTTPEEEPPPEPQPRPRRR
jgi:hypothetical protein